MSTVKMGPETVRSLKGPKGNIQSAKLPGDPDGVGQVFSADDARFARLVGIGAAVNIAAPVAADKGAHTQGRAKLHLVVEFPDALTSADISIWVKHKMTGKWALLQEKAPGVAFGTAGVLTVAVADGVVWHILEIDGVEHVALEVAAGSGTFVNGSIWLGSVGGFSPADR